MTGGRVDGRPLLARLVFGAQRVGGTLGRVAQRGAQVPAQLSGLTQAD